MAKQRYLDGHPFDIDDVVVRDDGRIALVESIGWTGKSYWMTVRFTDTRRMASQMDLDRWRPARSRSAVQKQTLSIVASRLWRSANEHAEALEHDMGYDGGEFSGPANFRAAVKDAQRILNECGWTPVEFHDELIRRTSEDWALYCFPLHYVDELVDGEIVTSGRWYM